ncbi:ABC transporter permease subunit [Paraburkholderia agricolaris]|uniref:ABC transporter permease n=1 Tax=Paraburkholderia agricolaris TaxID=2152888 RepID=UPI0038BB59F3
MTSQEIEHDATVDTGRSGGQRPGAGALRWRGLASRGTRVALLLVVLLIVVTQLDRYTWASAFPTEWTLNVGAQISRFLHFLTQDFSIGSWTVIDVTRLIANVIGWPQDMLSHLMTDGFVIPLGKTDGVTLPPVPWFSLVFVLMVASAWLGGRSLFVLTSVSLLYFLVFGLWSSAVSTLVTVVVAIPVGCGLGVLLGITGYRSRTAEMLLEPAYDIMQTLPIFSYLVLIVLFFGFGATAGLIALVIYAMPPMARITTFALRRTPQSILDLAAITGCTPLQQRWLVQLPAARVTLLTGLNQVIMLTFSTVIICAIIGGQGLGTDVLRSLKSMRLGAALEAGFAITLMAIMLDRACRAWVMRRPTHGEKRRFPMLTALCVGMTAGGVIAVSVFPDLANFPDALQSTPGALLNDKLRVFNLAFQPELSAFRDTVVLWLLRPCRGFFESLGWLPTSITLGAIALLAGGRRLAVLVMALLIAVAVFGLWPKAMLSLYLVSVSTATAVLIGLPLGILAGLNRRAFAILGVVADTIQTLPPFVYLIPVVVLFDVGDFAAFCAIVLYALAPVCRYIAVSLQQVSGEYKDVAAMTGCNGIQQFFHVQLPLALPQMLLGVNQTIMLSFGMLVIVALVGSQGLEASTLVAVGRVQPGEGLVAGLGIAAFAIAIDRIARAASRKLLPEFNRGAERKA